MYVGTLMEVVPKLGRSTSIEKATIDSFIDRLHHRVTVAILFGICFVISSVDFAGDVIDCHSETYRFRSILNSYCFYHSYVSPKCFKRNWDKSDRCIYSGVGAYGG